MPPSLTTTTTNNCTNPLQWILSKFTETEGKSPNKIYPPEQLDRILDKGIVMPLCEFCCPCPDSGYVLASVESYLKFLEQVPQLSIAGTCCTSFSPTIDQFGECILPNVEDIDRILDKGIVEAGLINGQSQLPILYQWILSILQLGPGGGSGAEIIDTILDKGIVIWCDKTANEGEGNIVIASVETFLKYDETVLPPGNLDGTCCINVYASVETYMIYNQGTILP